MSNVERVVHEGWGFLGIWIGRLYCEVWSLEHGKGVEGGCYEGEVTSGGWRKRWAGDGQVALFDWAVHSRHLDIKGPFCPSRDPSLGVYVDVVKPCFFKNIFLAKRNFFLRDHKSSFFYQWKQFWNKIKRKKNYFIWDEHDFLISFILFYISN